MLNIRAMRNGAILLGVGTGTAALIKFISVPILARLLTPEQFGIAGSALVLASFAAIMSGGSGLGSAVTYFKKKGDVYDHALVWTAMTLGIMVSVACWIFSDFLANSMSSPSSAPYIKTVAFFFPFSVMAGVGYAFLARDFHFRTITIINVMASISSATVAIAMALEGYGAWSLVAQYCSFSVVKCLGYFSCSRYRPKFILNVESLKNIIPFAYRLTVAEALMWVSGEGPFVIVTSVLGVKDSGTYRLIQRLTSLPREAIGQNLAKTGYVGMAETDLDGAKEGFLWSTKTSAYLQGALLAWFAALAQPSTSILLGSQFADAWVLASILSVGLCFQSHTNMVVPYLKSRGQTRTVLLISAIRTAGILVGAWFGINMTNSLFGVGAGIATAMVAASLFFLAYMHVSEKIPFKDLFFSACMPLIITLTCAACVFSIDQVFVVHLSDLYRLLIGCLIWLALYGLMMRLMAPQDIVILTQSAKKIANKVKPQR